MAKKKEKKVRCEGWRRHGTFTMGGSTTWKQCENDAILRIRVKQKDTKVSMQPSCQVCLDEALAHPLIEILAQLPLER